MPFLLIDIARHQNMKMDDNVLVCLLPKYWYLTYHKIDFNVFQKEITDVHLHLLNFWM